MFDAFDRYDNEKSLQEAVLALTERIAKLEHELEYGYKLLCGFAKVVLEIAEEKKPSI